MRYGFVSDVHGDLEGLQWALSALASVDQVVFLGDVCGGREVAECLQLLRSHSIPCVPGNHDLWDFELVGLKPELRQFLLELPFEYPVDDWLAVHSLYDRDDYGSRFHYIHCEEDARRAFTQFPQRLVFFGHTHLCQLHRLHPDGSCMFGKLLEPYPLQPECRYLLNVGAAHESVLIYDDELQLLTPIYRG